jgi:hypothetical protein
MLLVRPTWTHSPLSGTRWVALASATRLVGGVQLRQACMLFLYMVHWLPAIRDANACWLCQLVLLLQFAADVLPE